MKTTRILLPILLFALFISAKKEKKLPYDLHYVEQNMVYIPILSFVIGSADEDIPVNHETKSQVVSVGSFYMNKFEITNGLYCYYLQQLQLEKTDTPAYRRALPDTLVWRDHLAYNEPYVEYYLRHPAYANYPLVGVRYDQAEKFCEWLTKTYNAWPEKKFKNVKFDLPSKNQWMAAAKGGLELSPFPWGGPYMMNKDGKWMANFCVIDQGSVYRKTVPEENVNGNKVENTYLVGMRGGETMGIAGSLDDGAYITAPVNSYSANGYGLFNMAGNVEEMVNEKGITKGGSWKDPGYYLRNEVDEIYTDSTNVSAECGFRIMMTVGD